MSLAAGRELQLPMARMIVMGHKFDCPSHVCGCIKAARVSERLSLTTESLTPRAQRDRTRFSPNNRHVMLGGKQDTGHCIYDWPTIQKHGKLIQRQTSFERNSATHELLFHGYRSPTNLGQNGHETESSQSEANL